MGRRKVSWGRVEFGNLIVVITSRILEFVLF